MNLQENILHSTEISIAPASHKNWLKMTLMIIAAVGLVGIGVFVGIKIPRTTDQDTSQTPSPTPLSSTQPTITLFATQTSNETMDWQTFHNERFDFTLKYPPEYTRDTLLIESDAFSAQSKQAQAIGVKVDIGESGCHDNLCEIPAASQSVINGIQWDNLGSTQYCDAGGCTTSTAVYRTERQGNRFYVEFYKEKRAEEIMQTFEFGKQL